jgi:hypothetical protein
MSKTIPARWLLPAVAACSISFSPAWSQSLLYTRNGDKDYDRLAVSVHSAGDVDQDGRPDFIVGAPEDGFIFGVGEGYARVYSGANGSTLYALDGAVSGDAFGTAVGAAGDVDADGYADVVVGSPGAGVSASQAGRVVVYSGQTGALLWSFDGAVPGEALGVSVAGAGDVNGDGYADILTGAPLASGTGPYRGLARVYSGKTGAVLRTFVGVADGDRLGASVDAVGDINGDGKSDVIVGSYAAGAKIYSGATGSVLYTFTGLADDRLGYSVAGAGDVNGDGVPDVIVGAPQDGNIFFPGAGYAVVYSGASGLALLTLNGTSAGDRFGCAVAGARDINGDGRAEVMVGADQFAFGGNGYVTVFNGNGGAVIHSFTGASTLGRLGDAIDGLGDVNGDGKADFALGAPNDSTAFQQAGQLAVWSTTGSGCAAPANYCTALANSTGVPASIGSTGSTNIAANDFVLTAAGCPANKLGLFLYGPNQAQIPLGNGTLCVGNPFHRLPQLITTGAGTASYPLNYNNLPVGGSISAGQTWNFTFWFRDPAAGGGNTNLSNGRQVTFCP